MKSEIIIQKKKLKINMSQKEKKIQNLNFSEKQTVENRILTAKINH